jgi:chaperonin GroEL
MQKVGNEGVITVEENKSLDSEVDIVEGMQFDRGYLSPYFVTNAEKMTAELEDPYILLHEKKLSGLQADAAGARSRGAVRPPLLIIAEDVEGEALATLVVNRLRGGLKVAAVKAPGFGDRRKAMLEDIAILTGGAGDLRGTRHEAGEASRWPCSAAPSGSSSTRTTPPSSTAPARRRTSRPASRRSRRRSRKTTSDYDREKLQERLAKLAGGVAVIKRRRRDRESRSRRRRTASRTPCNATRAAVEEGIVAGGGAALLRAKKRARRTAAATMPTSQGRHQHRAAARCRRRCARSRENAGVEGSIVVGKMLDKSQTFGFDAQKGEYVDMVKSGIIDPAKVVRTALQDAASVAGLLVTTEAMIAELPDAGGGAGDMSGGMGGMGGGGMGGMGF